VPKSPSKKQPSSFYVLDGITKFNKNVLSNKKITTAVKTTIGVSELILLSPLHIARLLKGMYWDNTVLSTKDPQMSTGQYVKNMLIKVALPVVIGGGLIYGLTHTGSTFNKTVTFGGTAWVNAWVLGLKATGATFNFVAKNVDWAARHLNTMTSPNPMPIINPGVVQTTTTMC
jgi:hypothetical protein